MVEDNRERELVEREKTWRLGDVYASIFLRSAESYKYMMTGMGALAFLIVNISLNDRSLSASQSLRCFVALSSCVLSIAYIYFNYRVSLLALSGYEISRFNINEVDHNELCTLQTHLCEILSQEMKSKELNRSHKACVASIAVSLLTFVWLLFWIFPSIHNVEVVRFG